MYAPTIDELVRPGSNLERQGGQPELDELAVVIDEFDCWTLPDSPARLSGPCWCDASSYAREEW